jgi:hypothetical protein
MDSTTIAEILRLIEQAEQAEEEALRPENAKTQGYAFACGYQRATLGNIRKILGAVNE